MAAPAHVLQTLRMGDLPELQLPTFTERVPDQVPPQLPVDSISDVLFQKGVCVLEAKPW